MAEFEQIQGQIRNVLHGAANEAGFAAQDQAEAGARMNTFGEGVDQAMAETDGVLRAILDIFQPAYTETWMANNACEMRTQLAIDRLHDGPTSDPGIMVEARLKEDIEKVRDNVQELDQGIRDFEVIRSAIDHLKALLKAKGEQTAAIARAASAAQMEFAQIAELARDEANKFGTPNA